MTPVIEARNAGVEFRAESGTVHALMNVSLDIARGEYVAIVGPSGSGKSTLLHLLGGLERPTSGGISVAGHDLAGLDDDALARLRLEQVGFVFQRFHLLPVLSAAENIELPMAERGLPRSERAGRVARLLDYVGLANRGAHRVTRLSGGEMQRVAIARALANDPSIILADEPTGELDAATGETILDLFDRLHADGATLVVVTHDDRLASRARRVVRMLDGRVVA